MNSKVIGSTVPYSLSSTLSAPAATRPRTRAYRLYGYAAAADRFTNFTNIHCLYQHTLLTAYTAELLKLCSRSSCCAAGALRRVIRADFESEFKIEMHSLICRLADEVPQQFGAFVRQHEPNSSICHPGIVFWTEVIQLFNLS